MLLPAILRKDYLKTPSMKNLYLIATLFLLTNTVNSQSIYFPPNDSDDWETVDPAELGYCQENIDSLYQFLESINSNSFILLKNGKIVLEKYFGNFGQDSIWYWASAGKTLTATLVGIAEQEGLLSLQDKTSMHLGDGWTSCTSTEEEDITIWNQLTMTTGLDDGVSTPDCSADSCLQCIQEPGMRWAYHNGPYNLLSSIIESTSGLSFNQFSSNKLENKIGVKGIFLSTSGYNNVYFSNPRSFARFGLFLLAKGNWDGDQILNSDYVEAMTQSSQQINEAYGYLTWINTSNSFMVPQTQIVFPGSLNPDAPMDSYGAMGKNGQLLNVAPSDSLIWLRMGPPESSDNSLVTPILNNQIWRMVNNLSCLTSSTKDQSASEELTIYPNPTASGVTINASAPISHIAMLDYQGKAIASYCVDATEQYIPLEHLSSGIYILQIQFKNGTLGFEKIVKR